MPQVDVCEPLRVKPGATVLIESGGKVKLEAGAIIAPENGVQAAAITDALTGGSATAADCASKINSMLAALRAVGIIASA